MAKLLKHLGFGGKKGNPHPPKPDYGAQKSTSVQELPPCSPSGERPNVCLSAAASHVGDFDTASLVSSPARMCTDSQHHRASVHGHGGARAKDTACISISPKSLHKHGRATDESQSGRSSTNRSSLADAEPPPALLAEYSDPVDLKTQTISSELLGACAATPVIDDDYSVPYEVKKLIRDMKLRESGSGSDSGSCSPRRATTVDAPPDYDEPWDWSTRQSAITRLQGSVPVMLVRGTTATADDEEEEEEDEEGYTHLRDEFSGVGNYEEPWDLSSMQRELEDKIKAAGAAGGGANACMSGAVGGTPASCAVSKNSEPKPVKSSRNSAISQHQRPPEGYEAPWDWQPDRKDARAGDGYERPWDLRPDERDLRGGEGYEPPWDWKPDRKDVRSGEGYEAPWDRRRGGGGTPVSGGTVPAPSVDSRPPNDYDEPWDKRLKNKTVTSRTASDASVKSSQSPKSKSNFEPVACSAATAGVHSWTNLAERIDPKVPLEQQGWYHGSISRIDAERLLRIHKEGSYLVRKSESNKLDFSLSLKSARAFMHMKIVNRDGRFILGEFSQPFAGIPAMIHHYSVSKLPIRGAEHMSLLHPVVNDLL